MVYDFRKQPEPDDWLNENSEAEKKVPFWELDQAQNNNQSFTPKPFAQAAPVARSLTMLGSSPFPGFP